MLSVCRHQRHHSLGREIREIDDTKGSARVPDSWLPNKPEDKITLLSPDSLRSQDLLHERKRTGDRRVHCYRSLEVPSCRLANDCQKSGKGTNQ